MPVLAPVPIPVPGSKSWARVAEYMPGRTDASVRTRWTMLTSNTSSSSSSFPSAALNNSNEQMANNVNSAVQSGTSAGASTHQTHDKLKVKSEKKKDKVVSVKVSKRALPPRQGRYVSCLFAVQSIIFFQNCLLVS
jgi:hypothetical protein